MLKVLVTKKKVVTECNSKHNYGWSSWKENVITTTHSWQENRYGSKKKGIEIEAKQELVLLSTTGDNTWQVKGWSLLLISNISGEPLMLNIGDLVIAYKGSLLYNITDSVNMFYYNMIYGQIKMDL